MPAVFLTERCFQVAWDDEPEKKPNLLPKHIKFEDMLPRLLTPQLLKYLRDEQRHRCSRTRSIRKSSYTLSISVLAFR